MQRVIAADEHADERAHKRAHRCSLRDAVEPAVERADVRANVASVLDAFRESDERPEPRAVPVSDGESHESADVGADVHADERPVAFAERQSEPCAVRGSFDASLLASLVRSHGRSHICAYRMPDWKPHGIALELADEPAELGAHGLPLEHTDGDTGVHADAAAQRIALVVTVEPSVLGSLGLAELRAVLQPVVEPVGVSVARALVGAVQPAIDAAELCANGGAVADAVQRALRRPDVVAQRPAVRAAVRAAVARAVVSAERRPVDGAHGVPYELADEQSDLETDGDAVEYAHGLSDVRADVRAVRRAYDRAHVEAHVPPHGIQYVGVGHHEHGGRCPRALSPGRRRRRRRGRCRRRFERRHRHLLAASMLDDTVRWFENHGEDIFGVFEWSTHVVATTADSVFSVFAIDVDGDVDTDLLSASFDDDAVAWYDNDGGQSYVARLVSTRADGAWAVTALDVDGDNDVDVFSASENDDSVVWYENDGSASFAARVHGKKPTASRG